MHPSYTGSNDFPDSVGNPWNIPMQAGSPFGSRTVISEGKYRPIFC